jgi:diguanylate cyclase (GGDEF)-like protein/PAS domain S-box-containing protein
MSPDKLISILLVFIGAIFIIAALLPAREAWKLVPASLRVKWLIISYLMVFFVAGYLFFDAILYYHIPFPVEPVTAVVFFGGAVFVFIIIRLARRTIVDMSMAESRLVALNDSLEQRVADRTLELKQSHDFVHTVLNSMSDAISIISVDDFKIRGVNRVFLEEFGVSEDQALGKHCHDITHGRLDPCTPPDDACPLHETAASGKPASAEHVHRGPHGEAIYAEIHTSPIFNEHGGVSQVVHVSRNITERKIAEHRILRSQQMMQTILDSMPYGVIIIGRDKKVWSANQAALSLMGYSSEQEVLGMVCTDTLCPADKDNCPILDLREDLDRSERILLTKNGKRVPILKTVVPVELDGEQVLLEAVIDISERKLSEEKIRLLAYYDSLTGLPNRTFYKELLSRALLAAQRHTKLMAILFIDMDFFKRINDTLGHSNGDLLLQAVAKRLVTCVRKDDSVARSEEDFSSSAVSRLGGDEFIVLLNELVHANDAAVVAHRILDDLTSPFTLSGQEVFISASIGISLFPLDGEDPDSLLKNADIAMYHAKEQGRNNFQFFSPSMNTSALGRLTLENDLRKALERGEFLLYYQPKVEVATRQLIGVEALIRWQHSTRGLVSPAEFIPLSEDTGLIVPIGEWVLRAACEQNKAWQAAGFAPLAMSVNLSNRQFRQKDLTDTIIGILRSTDMEPRHLELEITESTIMQNPDNAIAALRKLKDLGVGVSIDDFGTGYSSLNYLRRLPLDCLKIDRSFITNITRNADDAAITSAVVAMAHSLKLVVLAEGVEKEDQLALLQQLGCDHVQGYLFSKPVPAEEFLPFLKRRELQRKMGT